MKKILIAVVGFLLVGCGAQSNITFSSQMGSCRDGVNGAPYCMSMTIQNNAGGQNWINSTNFPISNLSLSLGGVTNVNYPSSQGSRFDPNNCLGSTISPGGSCTFYLQLNAESAAVGTHVPVIITANYTVNDTLFGGLSGSGNSSGSSSTTVYQTPTLMLSDTTGVVESYSIFGLGLPYHAESSEYQAYANANDNYYGFLYLGGSNGIYLSNESGYIGNATNNSSTVVGAKNLIIYGTTLYATPNNITSLPSVYSAGIIQESFGWSSYATGVSPSVVANVSANNGNVLYFANSGAIVQVCNPNSLGTNCTQEGTAVKSGALLASSVKAIGFSQLGTASGGISLTGVIAGTDVGLFAESGTTSSPANGWVQFVDESGTAIGGTIVKIVADNNFNIYAADSNGWIYVTGNGAGNVAYKMANLGSSIAGNVTAMAVDVSGKTLYVGTSSSDVYACLILGGSCEKVISSGSTQLPQLLGLNIITSLTNY